MSNQEANTVITFPIEALEHQEVREEVCRADVVLAFHKDTGGMAIFFGKDVLEEGRKRGTLKDLRVVGFTLDPDTDQLEYLGVAVYHLKGSCCYQDMDDVMRRTMAERQVPVRGEGGSPDFRMPAGELSEGMGRARMQGSGEDVWVPLSSITGGEIRHPPFPADVREKIAAIRESFKDVRPMPLEE